MSSDLRLTCEATWKECQACELYRTRTNVVLGYGNPKARLMFVGEGPGAVEDEEGKPFVGPTGELLINMLNTMGISRAEVFIDNIVACRATVKTGDDEVKDRPPTKVEIVSCLDRLLEAIYAVDPIMIVALGNTAFHALTNSSILIGKARGGIFETRIPGWETDVVYPVMATYHPSFLKRNSKDKSKPDSVWGQAFRDIKAAVIMMDIAANRYYGVEIPKR